MGGVCNMNYLVFNTLDEAMAALSSIASFMGYPTYPTNAATGEIDTSAQPTIAWDVPQPCGGTQWCIVAP